MNGVVLAQVKALYPGDVDWATTWQGNSLDLASIDRVCHSVEQDGGRAWVFIPKTNTFYQPHKYPHLFWVRLGLEQIGA